MIKKTCLCLHYEPLFICPLNPVMWPLSATAVVNLVILVRIVITCCRSPNIVFIVRIVYL